MNDVAALFVDSRGPYPILLGAENCWNQARDARKYEGPASVVAHPPCQLWGPFAPINFHRWGGEHNRPGNDGGCFASALNSVRKFGGVLEHPASSRAFAAHDLPKPRVIGWQPSINPGEWICEVWQSAYGHKARKRTWLFYCGNSAPMDAKWARFPGTHQIGQHDQRGKERNKPTLSGRAASETPVSFAEYLIGLARQAGHIEQGLTG